MKVFENDDAMDWVAELEDSDDRSAVHKALATAADAPARRAVARVMAATNSELRDLWSVEEDADPEDVAEWDSQVTDLRRRLGESAAA